MTELITDRLLLRPWTDADREPFAVMNADPAVMEHFPAPMTREQSEAFVDRMVADLDRRGFGLWALQVRDTGRFIGFTGLSVPGFEAHFTPAVGIGWRLSKDAWGKVMRRIGMSRRETDDFDHPRLEKGHRLERHVLYRITKEQWETRG